MNIRVTLDISTYKKGIIDIEVNVDQIIDECLRIVDENLNLNLKLKEINYCKSKRENRIISNYGSFKENNIYTGDILEFI
ncbi:hypothetical protein [Clostridium uliginosum]|uniref:WXG100 protein secretion system (Wss), protein YukD n=1 Tax=Clostridium uliginosum TaxID=119641 RepID=A0A1I1PMN4_9CLOT|nr:hypothetical protein [Clostridium uliginosum]SFD11046.1 hypothetical protein SAMN05421842_12023 [Clostridium uliginosum]